MRLPFSVSVAMSREKGFLYVMRTILWTMMLYVLSFSTLEKLMERAVRRFFAETVVREVNNYRMLLSLEDRGIHRDLFLHGKREPLSTDYLLNGNILQEGGVVLDVGANIGYYVLLESKLVGETGKVYAVEPVSANLKALTKNIWLNQCNNVETFRLAMGDRNGVSTIHISEKSNLCSMKRNKQTKFSRAERIRVQTVDSFLKGKEVLSLVRMDVEGYEINVVRGMPETLRKDVNLLMELHGHLMTARETNELMDLLEQNGYNVAFSAFDHELPANSAIAHVMKRLGRHHGILNLNTHTLRQLLLRKGCANVLLTKDG